MGCGDWNDGMNLVGRDGKGESVWLAWFLYQNLRLFADLARGRDDAAFAQLCTGQAELLLSSASTRARASAEGQASGRIQPLTQAVLQSISGAAAAGVAATAVLTLLLAAVGVRGRRSSGARLEHVRKAGQQAGRAGPRHNLSAVALLASSRLALEYGADGLLLLADEERRPADFASRHQNHSTAVPFTVCQRKAGLPAFQH